MNVTLLNQVDKRFFLSRVLFLASLLLVMAAGRGFALEQESTAGEGSVVITADKQYSFAQNYFETGEYYRAIGEFERFIFFFPDDPRAASARFQIAMGYFNGKKYRQAAEKFTRFINTYETTPLAIKAHFMLSDTFVKLSDISAAVNLLEFLISDTESANIRDEAYYRIGWIYLESNQPEKARKTFEKISSENRRRYRLKTLSSELDTDKLFPVKNPKTAGFLSVIPGAGFAYCGRYQDSLVAFLLNTGFIAACLESFDSGNEALGGIIAFVGTGFYVGNIYGAVNAAHKFNRDSHRKFMKKLKSKTAITLSKGRFEKFPSPWLSFRFTF